MLPKDLRYQDRPLPEAWRLWTPKERGVFLSALWKRLVETSAEVKLGKLQVQTRIYPSKDGV
jgi:hypothetical protein